MTVNPAQSAAHSAYLGEILVRQAGLSRDALTRAMAKQREEGGELGEILVRMNAVSEDLMVRALSKQLAIPVVSLEAIQGIPPHVKAKVPQGRAREMGVLPLQLRDDGKTLVVAMAEPQDLQTLDALRAMTSCRIVPQLAGKSAIGRAFARFYDGEADLSDSEGSFKMVDAQGNTVSRAVDLPRLEPPRKASRAGDDPGTLLESVEEAQRQEGATLKAMVELLIEKGVFTRDEYLAKVKR
jgi:hypothetical protein